MAMSDARSLCRVNGAPEPSSTARTSYVTVPRGARTTTVSPTRRPTSASPTGDSIDSLPRLGSASIEAPHQLELERASAMTGPAEMDARAEGNLAVSARTLDDVDAFELRLEPLILRSSCSWA